MGSKPRQLLGMWKKRSQKDSEWVEGGRRLVSYVVDDNTGRAGVQNYLDLDNIPHDPSDDIIDVVAVAVGDKGQTKNPRLVEFAADTVSLTALIDASTTSVPVSAATAGNDFADNSFIKIEDELMQITSGGGTTSPATWTVKRAQHGTTAASHADTSTVYRMGFNVPHRELTLSGNATVLDAPSLSLVQVLRGFYIIITPPSDPNGIINAYELYRDTSSSATTLHDTIPATGQAQIIFESLEPGDDPSVTYYFRMKSKTKSGVLSSSFSNEVSGVVLTVGEESPAAKPDAPSLTVTFNGWSSHLGFGFVVGVTESSTTGIGGITKCQLQVAEYSATHSTSTGFSATVFDETKRSFRTVFNPFVTKSSNQSGGKYQFSARFFNHEANGGAGQWSDWSAPTDHGTIQTTAPDTDYPGAPFYFDVLDNPGATSAGNNVRIDLQEPQTNQWSVYRYEIQASTAAFTASLADALSLTSVSDSGTCDVSHAGTVASNLSASLSGTDSNAGDIVFFYKTVDTSSGEVEAPFATTIASNTTTTLTINSKTPFPYDDTVGLNFAIAPSWDEHDLKIQPTTQGPLSGGIERVGGEETSEAFRVVTAFSEDAYWRCRAKNQYGWGRWVYHNGSGGTTTRASATQFSPSKLQTAGIGDQAVTAAKQSLGTQIIGTDVVFTPNGATPHRNVDWTAGDVYFPDGTSESVNSGSSGALTGNTTYWVYKNIGSAASATLQVTSTIGDTVGDTKYILAQVLTNSDSNEELSIVGPFSGGSRIAAHTLNVNTLSAITANVGELTAGTITGLLIRTGASGARIELTSSAFQTYDSGGTKRVEIPTSADKLNFFDGGGSSSGSMEGDSSGAGSFTLDANNVLKLRCGSSGAVSMQQDGTVSTADFDPQGSDGVFKVTQASAIGAIPVLELQQNDVSEEMMELDCTVGTGNAIEAVGSKTLTTTHFVKVTITGVGTRYFPVGTIA